MFNNKFSKFFSFLRSCKIGTDVAFGAGTIVGEDSHITNSVIGRNCKIGKKKNFLKKKFINISPFFF